MAKEIRFDIAAGGGSAYIHEQKKWERQQRLWRAMRK
jgi:hypothetical protein